MTTNLLLEVDEEAGTATARSYWTVLQAVPGLLSSPFWPVATTTGSSAGKASGDSPSVATWWTWWVT